MKIVFFGECMLEQRANGSVSYGGDSLNSALYFSRTVGHNEPNIELPTIYYATGVGVDDESEQLLLTWKSELINVDLVKRVKGKKLGRYTISTNEAGERKFIYERDDSAAKYYLSSHHLNQSNLKTHNSKQDSSSEDASHLQSARLISMLINGDVDFFYFTGISLAILFEQDCNYLFSLLEKFKAKGGKVIFDNNYRSILWDNRNPLPYYKKAMLLADIAFLTDDDEYALYRKTELKLNTIDSIFHRYQSPVYQDCEIIIKQGNQPCFIRPAKSAYPNLKQSVISVKAQQIDAIKIKDTSAAGDAFSGAYLSKRLAKKSIEQSACFAHALAGRVIQHDGAIIDKINMVDLMFKPDSLQKTQIT